MHDHGVSLFASLGGGSMLICLTLGRKRVVFPSLVTPLTDATAPNAQP